VLLIFSDKIADWTPTLVFDIAAAALANSTVSSKLLFICLAAKAPTKQSPSPVESIDSTLKP
jgi:hypothetical protein